jgi:hypothetical protein
MKLKDAETLKDRASEYCFSEEEYKRFCKIIDEEPDALSLEKAKDIVEDRGILDSETEKKKNNVVKFSKR